MGTKKPKGRIFTCFECRDSFRIENDRIATHEAQLVQAAQARNIREETESAKAQDENQQSPTLNFLPLSPAPFDLNLIVPETEPNSPEEQTETVPSVISPSNVHFRQLFTHIDYYDESGGDWELFDSW
jgi:hypothetical protein